MRPGERPNPAGGPVPRVVGIAGPSGSGKTTLARALAERSGGIVFALDAYYRDQRGRSHATIQVDVPDAIDIDLAVAHLRDLVAGSAVDQPVYDYATHSRTEATRTLDPAPFVLVEGLFALYWTELRALCQTRVFVALDHDECLRRRIERDVRERGRTPADVTAQYERVVRPMYEQHVAPTRSHAHLVLDGRASLVQLTESVMDALAPRSEGEAQG
ncbi:MAG TPA: AAA family ATPase [Candidatus Krumholzibacteria bacterium]|nr:AAA family ATPase [Candidatus Krumholzibacteria bacterium]